MIKSIIIKKVPNIMFEEREIQFQYSSEIVRWIILFFMDHDEKESVMKHIIDAEAVNSTAGLHP